MGGCPLQDVLCAQAVQPRYAGGLSAACALGFFHGLRHGLAQHKLAPQQLHRAQGGGDHGFGAEFAHQSWRRGGGIGARQKMFGQRNGGAGNARQQLVAALGEVGAAKLVGRQGNGGVHVGHAQQGLGQAHQGQALGAGNRVFLEQTFHGPKRRGVVAHCLYPGRGHLRGAGPVQRVLQAVQALGHDFGLVSVGVGQALGNSHGGLREIRWKKNALCSSLYRLIFHQITLIN